MNLIKLLEEAVSFTAYTSAISVVAINVSYLFATNGIFYSFFLGLNLLAWDLLFLVSYPMAVIFIAYALVKAFDFFF
jgi:hypothetical protein